LGPDHVNFGALHHFKLIVFTDGIDEGSHPLRTPLLARLLVRDAIERRGCEIEIIGRNEKFARSIGVSRFTQCRDRHAIDAHGISQIIQTFNGVARYDGELCQQFIRDNGSAEARDPNTRWLPYLVHRKCATVFG
jgi:hypothetical protein